MVEDEVYVMLMMMRADDSYTPNDKCTAEEMLACIMADDQDACMAACTGEEGEEPEEPVGDGFVTVSKGTIPADQTVAKNAIEANLGSIKLTAGDHDTTISSIEITKSGLGEEKDITDLQIMYKGDYVSNAGKVKNSKATIRFTPAITIKAKSSMTFDIVANLSGDAGNNFGFSVTDVVVANGKSTGTPVRLGNLTTANYSVKTITTDIDAATATLKAGDSKKTILTVNLDNSTTSDTNVTDMVVSASNTANPREVDLDETFANIKAYVDDKEVGKVTINEESLVISNLNLDINRSDDVDVVLKGDVVYAGAKKTLTFELSSNRVTATEKINGERMGSSVSSDSGDVEGVDLKVESNWKGEDPQKVSIEDGKVTLLDLMVKADSSTEITQFSFNLNGVDLTKFVDQELTLSVGGYEYSYGTGGSSADFTGAGTTGGIVFINGKNDSFFAPARILVTAKIDKNATGGTIDKMSFDVSGVIINDILVPVKATSTKLLGHKTTIEDGSVKLAKRNVNDENTLKGGEEHEVLFFDLTAGAKKQTLTDVQITYAGSTGLAVIADSARLIAEVDGEERELISWDTDDISGAVLYATGDAQFEELTLERDNTVKFTLLVDLKDEVSTLGQTGTFAVTGGQIVLKDTGTNIKGSDVKGREYTVADVTPTVDRNLTAGEDYVEFTLSNDSEYDVVLSGNAILSIQQKASQNVSWGGTGTLLDANGDVLYSGFAQPIPGGALEFDFTNVTDIADRTISSKGDKTYRIEINANRFSIDELSIILKSIQFVYVDEDDNESAQITKKW